MSHILSFNNLRWIVVMLFYRLLGVKLISNVLYIFWHSEYLHWVGRGRGCYQVSSYICMKNSNAFDKKNLSMFSSSNFCKRFFCHSPHSLGSYEGYEGEQCQCLHPGYWLKTVHWDCDSALLSVNECLWQWLIMFDRALLSVTVPVLVPPLPYIEAWELPLSYVGAREAASYTL